MNKALLALCLFLAFASIQATYTPKWTSCDAIHPYRTWESLNVTMDLAPAPSQKTTFTLCGRSHTYEFFPYNITVTSGLELNYVFPGHGNIWNTYDHCFAVTFKLPQGPKQLNLQFVLNGVAFPGAGCVHVMFSLDDHRTFLGHSF